jgi:hypothetical protein
MTSTRKLRESVRLYCERGVKPSVPGRSAREPKGWATRNGEPSSCAFIGRWPSGASLRMIGVSSSGEPSVAEDGGGGESSENMRMCDGEED